MSEKNSDNPAGIKKNDADGADSEYEEFLKNIPSSSDIRSSAGDNVPTVKPTDFDAVLEDYIKEITGGKTDGNGALKTTDSAEKAEKAVDAGDNENPDNKKNSEDSGSFGIPENSENSENAESSEASENRGSSPRGDRKSKKKMKTRKPAKDSNTASRRILIGILVVGVCLFAVSLAGIFATVKRITSSDSESDGKNAVPTTSLIDSAAQGGSSTPELPGSAQSENVSGGSSSGASVQGTPTRYESWLDFFNQSVNKIKTDGPSFTKTKQTTVSDIQLSNSLAQAYVSVAKDKFLTDEAVSTDIAAGDTQAAEANVSPDGASYVSSLTDSDIKNISCQQTQDGNYYIRIDMADAQNPGADSSFAKVFQYMTVDDVMDTYAPNMGATVDRSNVTLSFENCYLTATVTTSGEVIEYTTYITAHMILKDAKVSVVTTDLDVTLISSTVYNNFVW